jgi:hypothetical protein
VLYNRDTQRLLPNDHRPVQLCTLSPTPQRRSSSTIDEAESYNNLFLDSQTESQAFAYGHPTSPIQGSSSITRQAHSSTSERSRSHGRADYDEDDPDLPDAKASVAKAAEDRRREKLRAIIVPPSSDSDDSDELVIVDGPQNSKGRSPPPLSSSPSRRMGNAERRLRALSGKRNMPSLKRTESEVRRAGRTTIFGDKRQTVTAPVRHEDLIKSLRDKVQQKAREVSRSKKEGWEAKRAHHRPMDDNGAAVEPTQNKGDGEVSGMFGKKLEDAKARKTRGGGSDDENDEFDEDYEPAADDDYDLVGSGSEAAADDDETDTEDEPGDDQEDPKDLVKRTREPLAEITDIPLEGDNKENVNPSPKDDEDDDDEDEDAPVFRRPKRRRTATLQDDNEELVRREFMPPPASASVREGGTVGGFSQFFDESFSQEAGERFMVSSILLVAHCFMC